MEPGKSVQVVFGYPTPVILALPTLVTPRAYMENGVVKEGSFPRFNATFLIKPGHPDLDKIWSTLLAVIQANYPAVTPENLYEYVKADMFSCPFFTGDFYADEGIKEKRSAKREAFRGYYMLRASAGQDKPPGLSLEQNGVTNDLALDQRKQHEDQWFFPGAEVYGKIGFGPLKSKAGVACYLNVVVSYGSGTKNDSFGAGEGMASGAALKASVAGTVSPYNPVTGAGAVGAHPTSAPPLGAPVGPPQTAPLPGGLPPLVPAAGARL